MISLLLEVSRAVQTLYMFKHYQAFTKKKYIRDKCIINELHYHDFNSYQFSNFHGFSQTFTK